MYCKNLVLRFVSGTPDNLLIPLHNLTPQIYNLLVPLHNLTPRIYNLLVPLYNFLVPLYNLNDDLLK